MLSIRLELCYLLLLLYSLQTNMSSILSAIRDRTYIFVPWLYANILWISKHAVSKAEKQKLIVVSNINMKF